MIRVPDFVTKEEFDWAIEEAAKKKEKDFTKVEFFIYDEGLCVQCMHIDFYDDEPATVEKMHDFMTAEGYELDITDKRFHHEIYLNDFRRTVPERLKAVIRHSVKKIKDNEKRTMKIIWKTSLIANYNERSKINS